MMAQKRSTLNMPRLEMVKEPPVNSCGCSLLARALATSSRTCLHKPRAVMPLLQAYTFMLTKHCSAFRRTCSVMTVRVPPAHTGLEWRTGNPRG